MYTPQQWATTNPHGQSAYNSFLAGHTPSTEHLRDAVTAMVDDIEWRQPYRGATPAMYNMNAPYHPEVVVSGIDLFTALRNQLQQDPNALLRLTQSLSDIPNLNVSLLPEVKTEAISPDAIDAEQLEEFFPFGFTLPTINYAHVSDNNPYKDWVVMTMRAKKIHRSKKGRYHTDVGIQYHIAIPATARTRYILWTNINRKLRPIVNNFISIHMHRLSKNQAEAISLGNY